MAAKSFYLLIPLLLLLICPGRISGQIDDFGKIKWERERIAPGLIWKSSHPFLQDTLPQHINILVINLHKRKISISYNPKKNSTVSMQAQEAGAIAAVNGGFFNIKDGGSVAYIKAGGLIADTDTAEKWLRNSNLNASILIHKNGDVFLEPVKMNVWYDAHVEYPDILVTGPLLLSAKKKMPLPSTPLVINKHPRTVIAIKGNHKVLLATLDGRTEQARGMTLSEMEDLMMSLHCRDAVNLDGGGSTTMWISGKPFNGVVNMPCDNKKFDHEGERAVSDILIIK